MSVVKKRVTPKQLLASQNNGRRSHGPRTELGKQKSSLNAIKDGAYAQVSLAHMQALGEDPDDYARHLAHLRLAFDPQDAIEGVLVAGIAQLYWRLFRLQRGEAGFLASRRRTLQADREWRAHLARRAHVNNFDDCATAVKGLVNSPDCPAKFSHILKTLNTVRDLHLLNGFTEGDSRTFDVIFGVDASCVGISLISTYESCRRDFEKQPPATQEYRREYFLKALDEEISYFDTEFQLYIQREVEVPVESSDAQLLPPAEDLDRIIRYEGHLERLIEHKIFQLNERRRRKMTANAPGPLEIPSEVEAGDEQELKASTTHLLRGRNGKRNYGQSGQ